MYLHEHKILFDIIDSYVRLEALSLVIYVIS